MKTPCSLVCLIPYYNEGERLMQVLEAVTSVDGIDQIVCIDDGSDDPRLARQIGQRWPRLTVVRIPQNKGKAAAIRHGLAHIQSKYILLMDADLQHLDPNELSRIVWSVKRGIPADLLILRRVQAEWFVKISRADVLLSGERIIRRTDLAAILHEPVEGFQLEVAINEYMQLHQKRVCWVSWSATNTYKTKKRGPLEGMLADAVMYTRIVMYIGFVSALRQYRSFARQPLRLS